MASRKRRTVSQKINAYRSSRVVRQQARFKPPRIKGEVIYRNPKAVSVGSEIAERGKRIPFTLENVEWISVQGNLKGLSGVFEYNIKGGFGTIFSGKIKFKGVSSSQRVVLKKLASGSGWEPINYSFLPETIKRLNQSRVPSVKMAYLEAGGDKYIVMEPFVRSHKIRHKTKFRTILTTKFTENASLLKQLNLTKKADVAVFRQIVEIARRLSKAGLEIKFSKDSFDEPRDIDIFNEITLKSGKRKVFVQDLDLYLRPNDNLVENWSTAKKNILIVLSHYDSFKVKKNSEIAKRILEEVA